MIENIDENIGLMLGKLDEWGLLEKTVVIFTSDNGMTAGGSGGPDQPLGTDENGSPMAFYNAGMKGLKASVDEGGVRVPLFVRWDGRIPANRSIEAVTAHIDIFPTLAALAGAPLPDGQVEGRSLLPLLLDPAAHWPDRPLCSHLGRWPAGADRDDHQWSHFAVRTHRYRLVGEALFDMLDDPGQTTDIAAKHPDVVTELRAAYVAFWKQARPLMVNENIPMSPTRPFHLLYEQQKHTTGIPEWTPPEYCVLGEEGRGLRCARIHAFAASGSLSSQMPPARAAG